MYADKQGAPSKVWTSERVKDLLEAVNAGRVELSDRVPNPFWNSQHVWRAADIVFEYTPEELQELKRCSEDVIYFANKYCYAMTDDGILNIQLRDYQEDALKTLQWNNKAVWLASRQIGKAMPYDSTVFTPKGKGRLGDLKSGDKIYGRDGKLTNVIAVLQQGTRPIYNISFDDGSVVMSCAEHLWRVDLGWGEELLELKTISGAVEDGRNVWIGITAPIEYAQLKTDVDFYDAGKKLTDGIPVEWQTASVFQRRDLLDGILSGPLQEADCPFMTASDKMAGDVAQLIEGLGMIAMRLESDGLYVVAISHAERRRVVSVEYSRSEECACLVVDNHDHMYLTDHCVPTHNTIVSGIFLTWYLLFNTDKNLLVLANVMATTLEIIHKLKVIMEHLPFFMKPGVIVNNQKMMTFDNGCRLFGRATTKTAAIGMAVHFLYVDEFAHIPNTFIEPFWRSVYPTLSANKTARCVISSTPNGPNKFRDLYNGALLAKDAEGANEFTPMRVDYWQVPGRDDIWKQKEIANLGSAEDFNQEYGLQFVSSARLLIDADSMRSMYYNKTTFRWLCIPELEDLDIDYQGMLWHPKFDPTDTSENARFVLTIDTAGGGGGDYTVMHVFLLRPMPLKQFKMNNPSEENEAVSAVQVGMFRSNKTSPEDFSQIFDTVLYRVLGQDRVRVSIELDFRGNLVVMKTAGHPRYYDDIFVHTKHSENAKRTEIGVKYNVKNKYEYCTTFKGLVRSGRVVLTEKNTVDEFAAFGVDSKGSYSCQVGHDDCCMAAVTLAPYFTSDQFYEQADEVLEHLVNPEQYTEVVQESLKKQDREGGGSLFTGLDFTN